MILFSKKSKNLFLVLFSILACSVLWIRPAEARAKAGLWGDDDDEGDDWGGSWFSSDEKEDEKPLGGRSLQDEGNSDATDHSHHVHKEPVLQAAQIPLGSQGVSSWDPAKQSGSGFQSGNFAAHNESCSPTGKSCPKEQNLECSATDGTGRCQCISGFVYVRQTETCWVIPKSGEDVCAHDIQCHAGKWGSHSRCSKQSARCECFDYSTNGKRETALVDGVCYIQKSIGDLCITHEECDKTIRGDAYCKLGDHQSGSGQHYNGSCQCRDSHMFWRPLKACLKLSEKLNDECYITEQCQQGSLGQRSRCSEQGRCECYSPHNNTEMVYYEKLAKCFRRREYNDTCREVDECRASLGPDVECGVPESTGEEEDGEVNVDDEDRKVCYCPKGKVCRSSAFSTLFHASSLTLSIICAAVILGTF